MTTLLIIFAIIVAILLVLLIMVQNPKGGGLSSTFGGGGMNIGGVQSTNTFLDNSTWTLAIAMIALILLVNLTHPNRSDKVTKHSSIENTLNDAKLPAPTLDVPAQENTNGGEETQDNK